MKKNSTPVNSKISKFPLDDGQEAEKITPNLKILRDFTCLPFKSYVDEKSQLNAMFQLNGLPKDGAESLIRKRFYPAKGIQAGQELLNIVQTEYMDEKKETTFVIPGINQGELLGCSTDKYSNADKIIALGDQLARRDEFLNEQFNELYLRAMKMKISLMFLNERRKEIEWECSSEDMEMFVKYISCVFVYYKELQEINYTSANNRIKTAELIKEIPQIIDEIYTALCRYFLPRVTGSLHPGFQKFIDDVNKILREAVIIAEYFKLLGIENLLLKSTIFLTIHTKLILSATSGTHDYLLKMQGYIENHFKKSEDMHLRRLGQILRYRLIFESQCSGGDFLAALGNHDELLKSYHNSSGQEKIDLSNLIIGNRQSIILLFNALLSQNHKPEILIDRAKNLYSLSKSFRDTQIKDKKSVAPELIINLRNSHSEAMTELEQLLKNFIDNTEKLCPKIKKTKKNKKAKKIKKAKEVKEAQPQETNKSKPLLSSAALITTKSQQELCPLPKAEPCQPVFPPVPAPHPVTLRIPEAEIKSNKKLKQKKFHQGLKFKKNKEIPEPKTEEIVYELKAHATTDIVKAMIASHLLKTLRIDLAQSAIEILSSGWIGTRKDEVQPVTPDDRKRYALSSRFTHQIVINSKEEKRLNETYRIFAQWGSHKNERCLMFDQIIPKLK